MHRFILWWGIISSFLLVFPVRTFASNVVINEIFANPENEDDEFLELYNKTDSEIDLSGWKISDLVKSYLITDLKISPKSFLVLEKSQTGITLNNSNETVNLLDSLDIIVDTFSYETTNEGKTWSRVPDGDGSFVNNTDITKGSNNASPPTPTPTITPTPTKAPTPTKVPTATKSPTSTKIPTPENILEKSIDSKEKNDKNYPSPAKESREFSFVSTPSNKSVAGISDEVKNSQEVINYDSKTPGYLYSVTTGAGMLVLACAILLYRKFKAKKTEEDDDF